LSACSVRFLPHWRVERRRFAGTCGGLVSLLQLLSKPEDWAGRVVMTAGYFGGGPDHGSLYLHREDYEACLGPNSQVPLVWLLLRCYQARSHQVRSGPVMEEVGLALLPDPGGHGGTKVQAGTAPGVQGERGQGHGRGLAG
jgi:hypothetical protein